MPATGNAVPARLNLYHLHGATRRPSHYYHCMQPLLPSEMPESVVDTVGKFADLPDLPCPHHQTKTGTIIGA